MSRIDDLISKHCPNGVDFQEIGNIWIRQDKSKWGVGQVQE